MGDPHRNTERKLTFRIFNKDYSTSLSAINRMFGWDPNNACYTTDNLLLSSAPWCEGFDATRVWHQITEETFVPTSRNAKAASITHPALRYFHRILVQALFSRKEIGQVRLHEILFLWLATDDHARGLPKPNFGFILCQRFLEINQQMMSWSDIVLGGMITHIAHSLGVDPPSLTSDPTFHSPEPNLLGITELRRATFLRLSKSRDAKYVFLVKGLARCYLPSPNLGGDPDDPWRVPQLPIAECDLTPADLAARQAPMEEDASGDEHDVGQAPGGDHPHHMAEDPPFAPPHLGEGGSSSSAYPHSFDFSQFHSAISDLSTQMSGAFTSLTEEVHGMRRENQEFHRHAYNAINNLGADLDMTRRIVWRSHLGRAEDHPMERFPNYPQFPPQFDPRGGNYNDPPPPYDFSSYPWQPFYPPPGGDSGGQ